MRTQNSDRSAFQTLALLMITLLLRTHYFYLPQSPFLYIIIKKYLFHKLVKIRNNTCKMPGIKSSRKALCSYCSYYYGRRFGEKSEGLSKENDIKLSCTWTAFHKIVYQKEDECERGEAWIKQNKTQNTYNHISPKLKQKLLGSLSCPCSNHLQC